MLADNIFLKIIDKSIPAKPRTKTICASRSTTSPQAPTRVDHSQAGDPHTR